MLTARKVPRACQSCRLQLLSLFENGFTRPRTNNSARYNSTSLRPHHQRTVRLDHYASTRRFTSGARSSKDVESQLSGASVPDIEAVVREARQTFGETLPKDYLSAEEYILYERLYGAPLRETMADDLEYLPGGEEEVQEEVVRNVLLRENADGEFEEIELDPELSFPHKAVQELAEVCEVANALGLGGPQGNEFPGNELLDGAVSDIALGVDENALAAEREEVYVQGRNQREIDAIARLQKDMAAMEARPAEEEEEEEDYIEEEYEEDIEEDEEGEEREPDAYLDSNTLRTHPHTMTGRSGTFPTTISLPHEQLIEPISELLERTSMKHISEAAEKLFGGPGLPNSPSTRASKKHLPQTHIALDASQHRMTEIEADTYISAVMPGIYAPVVGTLVEVRKRLGSSWLRDLLLRKNGSARVLDAGAGGAGAVAWREIAQAEWDVMSEEGIVRGPNPPTGKTTVLVGADTLRHRVSGLLENTTFLPRLPDYVHSSRSSAHVDGAAAQGRKTYDVIIAPHTLFRLKEDFRRKNMVQNLWSLLDPNGGVLILIEKGVPRGFEAIAGAREQLLEKYISSPGDTATENEIESRASEKARFAEKEDGMIIAPCTNHSKCPMYLTPGLSSGRKDFCHFSQRFIRPPYLQQVLGASLRNHEDIKYSYIAVRRGDDARKAESPLLQGDAATDQAFEGYEDHDLPQSEVGGDATSTVTFNALSLPRAVLPPLKRRGHVTLDLCTPSGKLERWTVPKSFSKPAYRDARKSAWGDLWALGAKTRVLRSPRLGRSIEDGGKGGKVKGIRDGRMGKGGKKAKKNEFEVLMGPEGFQGIQEARSRTKFVRPEKRTKGGRIYKEKKPIGEDDI
ncbi:uncharacterized protein BP5553_06595 [Venustampulla echinocandica]|uniref:Uncharacterized protein n=1 Tax=Venustampulla echinocandica TaxID=2656787 RepID=A0A370TKD9_9HELO|nr:uncharacterized protein BP5553_06595 [Venustampulla echinocandica]RDL35983.1 hypothetical protein BP5553_06595 [Venustampulla echinocandica]